MAFCASTLTASLHLHLQNQVGAALQIEAEVDVIGHRREQPLPGKALRNPKDAEQEKQQRADDESELPEKILIHNGIRVSVSSFKLRDWFEYSNWLNL